MPKTITITDVIIKEVQIAQVDGEWVMNVLYAQVDDEGNEYPRGWEPIKGGRITTAIIQRLERVMESAKNEVKTREQLS